MLVDKLGKRLVSFAFDHSLTAFNTISFHPGRFGVVLVSSLVYRC